MAQPYLFEVGYTPAAMAALVNNPQDRREAVQPAIEKLGGNLEQAWFAFGDCDIVLVATFPDSVSALAFSAALTAGGAVRSVRTIPLMAVSEGVEALRQAATCGYKPVTAAASSGR